MLEEFWSDTVRLMGLAADCRATVAQTRAAVDDSWSVLHQVSDVVEARRLPPIVTDPPRRRPEPDRRDAPPAAEIIARPIAAPAVVNRLLLELPPDSFNLIMAKAKRVKLKRGQVLEQPRMPVGFAYFIESGIVSLQAVGKGASLIASGLIGSEGMTGLPVILRSMKAPLKAQVLIPGEALRISAEDLQSFLEASDALLDLLLSYVQAMLVQSAYVGLCSARHTARQRIRGWLLLSAAALGGSELPITHQAMARLLGLRRATVSDCLADLQRSGAIGQKRGGVGILDAEMIAQEACECHRVIRAEFAHLWSSQPGNARAAVANGAGALNLFARERTENQAWR